MDKKHREYKGQRFGDVLVKFLNDSTLAQNLVEKLLADAQVVFQWLQKYSSLHKFNSAIKTNKLPAEFWQSHQRLNERLATFIHAPSIDWHEFYDGNRVSWALVTEESPALVRPQIECVLQLIGMGVILKIRRCLQCTKWYFAHFAHQEFCKTSCKAKYYGNTEAGILKRREYQRDLYHKKKSGKVK
jgi:hypothetical protein